MKKKKVCMIAYSEYSLDARIRREAETLASDSRFEVTVLALKESAEPRTYLMDNVRVREVDQSKYRGGSRLQYMATYLIFAVVAFCHCSKIFASEGVDVVHVHNMPNFLVFSAIVPKIFGKKIVLDIHDSMPETFSSKFEKKSGIIFWILFTEESLSAGFANRVVCVNHVQRDVLLSRGTPPKKIYVSMNVPDHRRFVSQPFDNPRRKPGNAFNMVYHGTITRRLGTDLAVQAVAGLAREIESLHFHLWGRGDYLDEVKLLAVSLGVEERVHFHGTVPVDVLAEKLGEMDLGVVSNRKSVATELMLPVKMMEYVALGIPVVAPKLTCIQHYFSDDMVTYFEPEDVASMQQAILKMYGDKKGRQRQAEKAREFLEKFGWEKQSQDFINFYLGV